MQIRMNLHNIQLSKSKKICLNHGKSSRSDTNIEWFNYLSPDPLFMQSFMQSSAPAWYQLGAGLRPSFES